MNKLSERHKMMLDCISRWLNEKGFPPSVREIAAETGIRSTRGVTINLEALEKAGYLERDANARSIRLLHPAVPVKTRMLPLLGNVAAGPPILAEEHIEGMIPVPEDFSPENEDAVVLRVRGNSMRGDGIYDGDMVIVRKQLIAENGEMVAVIIDGEATVKRFFRDSPDIARLEPSNPDFEPIMVSLSKSETIIVGKVVGLLRSYR